MWPIEWHHCQCPWMTSKVTFANWNLSNSNTLWNTARTYQQSAWRGPSAIAKLLVFAVLWVLDVSLQSVYWCVFQAKVTKRLNWHIVETIAPIPTKVCTLHINKHHRPPNTNRGWSKMEPKHFWWHWK